MWRQLSWSRACRRFFAAPARTVYAGLRRQSNGEKEERTACRAVNSLRTAIPEDAINSRVEYWDNFIRGFHNFLRLVSLKIFGQICPF